MLNGDGFLWKTTEKLTIGVIILRSFYPIVRDAQINEK